MLACCHPRRQSLHTIHPLDLPSPSPSHSSFFDNIPHTLCTPSPSEFNFRNYFPSVSVYHNNDTTTILDAASDADQYMQSDFDYSNPSIRIQQSTPVPQLPAGYPHPSMLATENNSSNQGWNVYNDGNGQLESPLQTLRGNHRNKTHQRAPSSSSVGSNGSASQYSNNNAGHATSYQGFSNHLPTPSQTPTQDSFLSQNYPNYTAQSTHIEPAMAAHMAMKQALMDHHSTAEDDVPGFSHSARHSVSSYGHDSPATPHTTNGDDFEEKLKLPPNGESITIKIESWMDDYLLFDDEPDPVRQTVPKFDRTMSDIWQDELYNPANAAILQQAPPPTKKNPSFLSPFRNAVNERLQAAHNARSQSPSSSAASRGVSPFRHGSPYFKEGSRDNFGSPRARLGTAAEQREAQKAEADAYALKRHPQGEAEAEPKTISPKDAVLEYHETEEDSKMPLFSDGGSNGYQHQYTDGAQYTSAPQAQYDNTTEHSYANAATSQPESWATPRHVGASSSFATSEPSPPQSTFTFAPPSIPGNVMHGLPFPSQQYRPLNVTSVPEQTPEFPAHLTSMESSVSEAGGPDSAPSSQEFQKPAGSGAETGTYTCTYHGCTQRFETPQKLQKHKREGHRQNASATSQPASGIGSGMTSAALLARNSQAGPHRCDRINPTTGKPCNTIFSRPYDLTRHEDTIHNARKQKVRCALCVEEKTFSRNDALTRHMRVVHPEVDFPGKHRRRGGAHD